MSRAPRPPWQKNTGVRTAASITPAPGETVFHHTEFPPQRSDSMSLISCQRSYLVSRVSPVTMLFCFWYVDLVFITGILILRSARGTLREKRKKKWKIKVTLMSANLRLSVTCAVSNVGDVPAHAAIHLTWPEAPDEMKCLRLELVAASGCGV